jgi:hypothetical protein
VYQHLTLNSTNAESIVTCHVVPNLHLTSIQTVPVIFFICIKFNCTFVIAVDVINWKTTLCKTVLDSGWGCHLPGFCYASQIILPSIMEHSTIYDDNSLLNEVFSVIILECTDDSCISRL